MSIAEVFALVDCNNFFVSCERVFSPRLRLKPVAVLSNNDGVIVSRSNEVKRLGVPMGAPFFKFKSLLKDNNAHVFSSNFDLYSDMSFRVMETLQTFTTHIEPYSIDEAFLHLGSLMNVHSKNLYELGVEIKNRVEQWTGIPVSIGIARTKTLAKAANELGKGLSDAGGVLNFVDLSEEELNSYLSTLRVKDVWGIGYKSSKLLNSSSIYTALDFKNLDPVFVRNHMRITGLKTQMELKGISCITLDSSAKPSQSIVSSRTFGKYVIKRDDILSALSVFVNTACHRLRSQNSTARGIGIYLQTNRHKSLTDYFEKSSKTKLPFYSDETSNFIAAAHKLLDKIFIKGPLYYKAGVFLYDIKFKDAGFQPDLFSRQNHKSSSISAAIDGLNSRYGKNTLFYASNKMSDLWTAKEEHTSRRYTTLWSELPNVV